MTVHSFPSVTELEPWRSVQQVAKHYGFTTRWVYKQIEKGMPHRRISGKVRFRISELDEWLEAQG